MTDAFEMAHVTAKHRLRLIRRVINKIDRVVHEKEHYMAKRLTITETFDRFDPEDVLVAEVIKNMSSQVANLEAKGYRDITITREYEDSFSGDYYLVYQGDRDETDAEMDKRLKKWQTAQNKAKVDKKAQKDKAAQAAMAHMTREEVLAAWEAAQAKKRK